MPRACRRGSSRTHRRGLRLRLYNEGRRRGAQVGELDRVNSDVGTSSLVDFPYFVDCRRRWWGIETKSSGGAVVFEGLGCWSRRGHVGRKGRDHESLGVNRNRRASESWYNWWRLVGVENRKALDGTRAWVVQSALCRG